MKASEDQKQRFEDTELRIKAMIEKAQEDTGGNRDKVISDLHDVG